MALVQSLNAIEILDSRGRPTVKARCTLSSGVSGTASIPSGASTGAAEALELRDGDPARYAGLGCQKAVSAINHELRRALTNRSFGDQQMLDDYLAALDGTPNKARLGANALLAVSIAYARAAALDKRIALYQYASDLLGQQPKHLPRLTINLFSGGRHAGGQVAIQDVLIVPMAATIGRSLEIAAEIYNAAADLTHRKYSMRALKADEGGLAPPFPNSQAMLSDALKAVESASLNPGQDVMLEVDLAATQFYRDRLYRLDGTTFSSEQMVDLVVGWFDQYPILGVEDALAEEDWAHWTQLCARIGGWARVVGDDLLCTNPARIQKAISESAANALLLKVNQIGTLSEAANACRLARSAGWSVTVSARSGETEDEWLADLAVGWDADYIKVGSIRQSERLAKYNRLLEIESETALPIR